jgi:hypothetical protein
VSNGLLRYRPVFAGKVNIVFWQLPVNLPPYVEKHYALRLGLPETPLYPLMRD